MCFINAYSQFSVTHTNIYLLNGERLFSYSWEQNSKRKEQKFVNTISCLDLLIQKQQSAKRISYLGKDWSLHFVELDTISMDTNLILSNRYIENEYGKKFFPQEMYTFNPVDGVSDILVVFFEGEGPIYKVLVYRWKEDRIIDVFSTKEYFSYPSWNPFVERKKITVNDNGILMPYCEGCHSGKDGALKWAEIIYDKEKDEYLLKK